MDTLITIAMPVYNVEKYVKESILSVLEQTYDNIELLIVDDCGNDNSMAIVNSIIDNYKGCKMINIIKHEYNKGLSEARNTAIKEAKGDYIFFIDSDDFIPNDCIEKLFNTMKSNDVDFVVGSCEKINEINKTHENYMILENKTIKDSKEIKEYIFQDSKKRYNANTWNKLFKISFLREKNLFFVPNIYYEDNLFSISTYTQSNSCSFISDITYYYRIREGSIMQFGERAFTEKEIKNLAYVRKREKDYIKKFNYCTHFEDVFLSLSVSCFYHVKAYLHHNLNNLYIKPYIKELLYYPLSLKEVLSFKRKRLWHLFFWFLDKCPYFIIQLFV